MKTIDITFDLETCSLAPTAAVMSIGAIVWKRNDKNYPFYTLTDNIDPETCFSAHVDLRSMFLNGFTFDQDTANWWRKQNNDAKQSLLSSDADVPCSPINEILDNFFEWIEDMKRKFGATEVCLWSQGSDFDISILRNIAYVYHKDIPVKYSNFRDHRTFFLECSRIVMQTNNEEYSEKNAYKRISQLEGKELSHDPLYDCKRSIYSTWQILKQIA